MLDDNSVNKLETRPCPWCGQKPVIDKIVHVGLVELKCNNNKHCKVRPTTGLCDSIEEATIIWNQRSDNDNLV
jgi:hypothetical protein